MKKILIIMLTCLAMVVAGGCTDDYDDSDLWAAFEDLEDRVSTLEELCSKMNTNISALQTIVSALQSNDYITNVSTITYNGEEIGYTITFSKSGTITIYHGQDGEDGEDGADGQDGSTPVVGVKMDDDGVYYWTLNGDWLLDADGKQVRATGENGTDGEDGNDGQDGNDGTDGQDGADGKDGADGVTPQLKIENGYWYVSYDNGSTWTQIGVASSDSGTSSTSNCIFSSVTQDDDNVYFTLTDGSTITISKGSTTEFSISPKDTTLYFESGETKTIAYTITGATGSTYVKTSSTDSWKTSVNASSSSEGTITIIAPENMAETEILIFVNDDSYRTLMASITCYCQGKVEVDVTTAGTLSSLLGGYDYDSITYLKITGELNEDDFEFIRTNMTSLSSLDISELNITELPDRAFYALGSLTSVILPESLTSIGSYAFYECTGLTSITIPDSVISIGKLAFFECSGLTSVTIPDSVTSIGSSAFSGCSGLTSVTIPDSVTSIGDYAFGGCSGLTSVTIGNGVTSIEDGTFGGCSGLTSVTIGNGVTSIGDGAFGYCSSLTSITIPDSVTSIGSDAFIGCSGLTSIIIPYGVTSIGDFAFYGCGLTSIYCMPATPPTIGSKTFTGASSSKKIYVPSASLEAYQTATNWSEWSSYMVGYNF